VIPVGKLEFHVMETPGHSRGSVTLRCEDALFTGDTLFRGSCGRTDFPGSSGMAMMGSLRRLASLEGDYEVYPGHMDPTSLERERRFNPFVLDAMEDRD
jgi:glyoxylase-like metal-dependent hydrolase (beta-lactamase superfamily II)